MLVGEDEAGGDAPLLQRPRDLRLPLPELGRRDRQRLVDRRRPRPPRGGLCPAGTGDRLCFSKEVEGRRMEALTLSLRDQGIEALRSGDTNGAVDLLARAVMADGQDAEAQAFLGVAYSQKG